MRIYLPQFIVSIFILFIFTICCNNALAHPHVFIDQQIKVVFDDKGLSGFKIKWVFDDMFSIMIVDDYDKNRNEVMDQNEVALIKEKAFSNISKYNYFTFVKIEGKPFDVKYVQNFSAKLINKRLCYEFFVPCHVLAINSFKNIVVDSYDESYYSAIFFAEKNPVTLHNSEAYEIGTVVKEDKSTSIYYDMVNPWGLFLTFRMKQ